MTSFVVNPGERSESVTPIALLLRDDFTGSPILGRLQANLDVLESADWRATAIPVVRTASGVLTWPKLERSANPAGLPPRRYRIRLEAEFYIPAFRAVQDAIEFDAFPWNDQLLPAQFATEVTPVIMLPAVNYPFAAHVPVLRGIIQNAAGGRTRDALVTQGVQEQCLTNERGEFALPLRWIPPNVPSDIDVIHQRTGLSGATSITLPSALGINHTITIT